MTAPIIVAITDDYIASVTAYLQGRLRTDEVTIEAVRDALRTTAGLPEPEPDLFGAES
jgi:hypothetical protein